MKASADAEKGAVPRLRFPEFVGAAAWTEVTLKQAATVRKGTQLSRECKDIEAEFPHFNGGVEPSSNTAESNRDAGTIIISEGGNSCGFVQRVDEPFWCGGHCYSLHPKKGQDRNHLLYSLEAVQLDLMRLRVGSGLPNIQKTALESFKVRRPNPSEQRKIAACLGSLDARLAAEDRKLAALARHKRGLLQQLFPREGQTRPHLRFPEFRDAGEWRYEHLEELCEVLNNRRQPITSSDRQSGPFPYYGASGIVDYVDGFIFDETLVLVGEDGAKWAAFEETAFLAFGKYWVNNHAHVLKPYAVNMTFLVTYLFLLDLEGFVSGAAPPKLTLGNLRKIPIALPPEAEEQTRIAACLSTLDARLAAQARKIDALRTHKRGLMQQLFPALK